MGHLRLEQAMQAVENAGLRVQHGYPAGEMPGLTAPVAALWLHKVTGSGATVAVQVFCPTRLGGAACEDAALSAMEALEGIGGDCQLSACEYDRATGCWCVQVLAGWYTGASGGSGSTVQTPESLSCTVKLNGTNLPYLVDFSAEKKRELAPQKVIMSGTEWVRMEESCWVLTVEELLPHGATAPAGDVYGFTLSLTRSGTTETYTDCNWEKIRRQEVPAGVKQVRVAKTWKERSVG